MALDVGGLKLALKNAMLNNIPSPTAEQITAATDTATTMANAINTFVTGAQINYVSGLANSGGPVTGVFVGSLS